MSTQAEHDAAIEQIQSVFSEDEAQIGKTKTLVLPAQGGLDPITVFLQDFAGGQGQITIVCWGTAWSAYFGSPGTRGILRFIARCTVDYLENKFQSQYHQRKGDKYLLRVLNAVVLALSKVADSATQEPFHDD